MSDISPYLLVEWREELRYSVVSREKIANDIHRLEPDVKLIARNDVMVTWGRRGEAFPAAVISGGK